MKIEDIELEKVQHLGDLGFSLEEIEKMTEVEIEEHCFIPEGDGREDWTDERYAFEREAITNK